MLTSIDFSCCLHFPVSRPFKDIKQCSVHQLFFKQQLSSVEFYFFSTFAIFLGSNSAFHFLIRKTCEISAILKNTSHRLQGSLLSLFAIPFSLFSSVINLSFFYRMPLTSSKFGQRLLVLKNQLRDFQPWVDYFQKSYSKVPTILFICEI